MTKKDDIEMIPQGGNELTPSDRALQALVDRKERQQKFINSLTEKNPNIHFITAMVISGDLAQAEELEEKCEAGELTGAEVVQLCGSYARWQMALKYLSTEEMLRRCCELWSSSDPDDTDLTYLNHWREWRSMQANDTPLFDDTPLPAGRQLFTIYRGQSRSEPLGFAWSLDVEVALSFARGAGGRAPIPDPVLYTAVVKRADILAYITGRDEEEVIIDIERYQQGALHEIPLVVTRKKRGEE